MKEQLKVRTKHFAHRCIKLTEHLPSNYLGNHIKGQLIRSSTSVAANHRTTCIAQSKASFVAKSSMVIEEVDESAFWLEFIIDENLLPKEKAQSLLNEGQELTPIFIASRKTVNNNK